MSELLRTGNDYMNDEGDILPIDRSVWTPRGEFIPDHPQSAHTQAVRMPDRNVVRVPERGVSVSLEQRMLAVKAIMDYFNQVDKRNGLAKSRGYNKDFDSRYRSAANRVARGMSDKASRLYEDKVVPAFEMLAQSEQLKAIGFDSEEVDRDRDALVKTIYRQYGPRDGGYARERQKVVNMVTDTHDAVVHGKKPRRRSRPAIHD